MEKKIKAIYVGVNGELVKVWENGIVLNEELFAYVFREVSRNG